MVSNAEGDAARFKQVLAEYSKALGVMRERLYRDMMQQSSATAARCWSIKNPAAICCICRWTSWIQQTHPQQAALPP